MFGISFTELIIIIIFAVILINPKEYRSIFQFVSKCHKSLKSIYQDCMHELEELKSESNIKELTNKIENDIKEAEEEIEQIVGDDGKLYDSYDISNLLDKDHEQKNK